MFYLHEVRHAGIGLVAHLIFGDSRADSGTLHQDYRSTDVYMGYQDVVASHEKELKKPPSSLICSQSVKSSITFVDWKSYLVPQISHPLCQSNTLVCSILHQHRLSP